jgi:transcriptional regulator with XRE-family HTH domain
MKGYWVDKLGNKYGPFDPQLDGFPNAGQVVRAFCDQAGMTQLQLAKELGKQERWIREMERENKVPDVVSKRRTLAAILKIPVALFGLTTLGEETLLKRVTDTPTAPTVILGKTNFASLQSSLKATWNLAFAKGGPAAIQAAGVVLFF